MGGTIGLQEGADVDAIEERAPAREWEQTMDQELDGPCDGGGESAPVIAGRVVGGEGASPTPRVSDIDALYPEWSFG